MKILLNSLVLVALACQSAPAVQDNVRIVTTRSRDGVAVSDAGRTKGFSQLTVDDDAHGALSLTLQRDGSATATLDGVELPAERLVRDGDRLRVLDADGEALYDLQVVGDNLGLGYPYGEAPTREGIRFGVAGLDGLQSLTALQGLHGKPRHVIGVVTTPVNGAVAAQLGLDPDSAVIINEITPDMPAAKAGLLPFDVITHIDGSAPVTRELLRERVSAAAVGQALRITVLRRGQPQDVDVLVGETTDPVGSFSRLFTTDGMGDEAASVWDLTTQLGSSSGSQEAYVRAQVELTNARDSLSQRVGALRAKAELGGIEGESAAKAAAELEAALASLVEAQGSMRVHEVGASPEVRFFSLGEGGDRGLLMKRPPKLDGSQPQWLRTSEPPAEHAAADDLRLAQMEQRLAQLDARVAELVKALEAANSKP